MRQHPAPKHNSSSDGRAQHGHRDRASIIGWSAPAAPLVPRVPHTEMRPELLAEQACGKQTVSMSSLFVIAGPPGAGKTTMSALVSARLSPSALISGDAFFRFLNQGAVAPWLPEATEQNRVVIRASGAAAGQFARDGYETVFDGVMGPWWLPTFLEATGLDNLHYAILLPSADQCVQNVAAREGHVDEEATRDMHDQFQRALIDTRHLLMDPPASPEDTSTELLSRYRLGLFAYDARST